jgi:diaminohydroxyphosphoribosylaminopyrimidine deaminase/5-amino-6-(5-phosphoribosylamino)uracil reductase
VNAGDEKFVQRTLQLAACGQGHVSPNPLVGAVIIKEGRIIGEGFHRRYGEAHAEVNAVEEVKNPSDLVGATLYVNLEPCAHFGKTPPCCDLVINRGISRVVVGMKDPNPTVAGLGIQRMQQAGIEVEVMDDPPQHRWLNRRFLTLQSFQRPYLILKWAQTADAFVNQNGTGAFQISDAANRRWVHKWRATEQALMVGSGTAIHDQPLLSVRHWTPALPTRIFIDRFLVIPSKILRAPATTIVYNCTKDHTDGNIEYVRLEKDGFFALLLADLAVRGIASVLVEGGPTLHKALINAGLWDEMRISVADKNLGSGIQAPMVDKVPDAVFISGKEIRTFVHLNQTNPILSKITPTLWAL